MSARQKIIDQLKSMGASPKKSLGQNFLIGEGVVQKILEPVRSSEFDQIVEVGPGLGALTNELRTLCTEFKVIELDRIFAAHWRDQGLNVIEQDALKLDWADLVGQRKTHLVSNLPYQISSSLVIEVTESAPMVENMTLMFQKEVAQRILSESGQKSYGLLSIVAQVGWHIQNLVEVGPNEFYPSPKIASRVLHFRRKNTSMDRSFTRFVKSAFAQRRKKLIKNISGFEGAQKAMVELGLDENIRAEALTVSQFVDLYQRCGHGN